MADRTSKRSFKLDDARQCEIVLGLAADPGLADRLTESRARIAALEAERTPYNSTIQRCQRTKPPEGDRPEAIDVSAEVTRLESLREVDKRRGDLEVAIETAAERIADNAEAERLKFNEVDRIETQLATARAELVALEKRGIEYDDARREAVALLYEVPSVTDEMLAVRARIAEADEVNAALEPFKAYDRTLEELATAQKEAAALTGRIAAAVEDERAMMAESGIPIEGLTIAEDEFALRYKGHSLAVASGGEKIDLAFDIASHGNPALKIILVDEGNDLGPKMLAEVDAKARARGYQLLVCRLDGPGEIMVVDGVATSLEQIDE